MGQDLIKFVLKWLEIRGYKPLLASTDSALTSAKSSTPEEAWNEAQAVVKQINADLKRYVEWKYNPYEHAIKIGVEKIFDRLVIFDKRRYIMNTVIVEGKQGMIKLTKPKKYVKGLEAVRGDAALITKDMQDAMIEILTDGTKEDLVKYLKKVDGEFRSYPWAYICARASISNDINAGDSSNAHYNACRNANRIFNKNYDAGVRPLLGYFDKHPRKINGEYIPSGEFTMAFDENDEFPLKKTGFDLKYQRIKEANVIKKTTPFIKMFDKRLKYEDVIAQYDRKTPISR
jgi:DNA polymerase elongation subunit (family B)